MSTGFTDWPDLGIFPTQDTQDGVPVGMRMTLIGGRVKIRPEPGESGATKVTEYAREHGLGTLGDIHPWLFWQTQEREMRDMGSWSMAWGAVVTDAAGVRYGGPAGVQPLTVKEGHQVNDPRYRVLLPAWDSVLPWQPEGMLSMVMPSTDETEPGSVMLNGDRRLVAACASGPGQAGTTICDMQPDGELCMDGSLTPGLNGRHARLQGLVRVIALDHGSAPMLGGSWYNSIALNYGVSQQEGILGYGMIYGRAINGGGPTTGSTTAQQPAGAGGGQNGPDPPGRDNNGFASGTGGSPGSDAPGGSNSGYQRSVADFGQFISKAQGGHAVGFMAHEASGPIVFGCGKHRVGIDKDGHPMTSAHISTNGYFYKNASEDGPLYFSNEEYPEELDEHANETKVHLSWDKETSHAFVGGARRGVWRWWTTVPYVRPTTGRPPTAATPSTPGTPSRPTTPGSPGAPGVPGTPSTPGRPTTPGAPGRPGSPTGPSVPGTPGGPVAPDDIPNPAKPKPYAPATPNNTVGRRPGRAVTPARPRGPVMPADIPKPAKPPNAPPGRPVTYPEGTTRNQPIVPVAPGNSYFIGRGFDNQSFSDNFDINPPDGSDYNGIRPAGVVQQVGGAAGGGEDVGLFSIFHPHSTGFAAIALRPQLWIKGAPNFEHNPLLGSAMYRSEEQTRPTVLTIRAWGAQSESGDWKYAKTPVSSRARGGTADGGILVAPAEFEMEDYLGINSNADTDNPTASTYAMLAPNVSLAFGNPATSGGPTVGSKLIYQETAAGDLIFSEVTDVAGSLTEIIKVSVDGDGAGYTELEGTGALKVPGGSTDERPTTPAAAMVRYNSTDKAFEYYDGTTWNSLTPGGGGGGGVTSVNGHTGVVVLDPDDLNDASTSHKFVTSDDITNLSNLSGTNTGDEPTATTGAEGVVELATTAEAEAGSATDRALTPASVAGLMKLLPKAFGSFDPKTSPVIKANHFNLGGTLTRNGTGDYTLTYDTALADANYTVTMSCSDNTGTAFAWGVAQKTTTTLRVFIRLPTGAASDAAELVHIVVHQNLAP